MENALHFVRFESLSDERYWNATRVFGLPDFVHRKWDRRARREIMDGDTIVFARGSYDQPLSEHNGNDEAYQ